MSARGRSADTSAENGEGGVADGGPGLVYMSFVVMEDLLDKLKLLNYEEVRDFHHTFKMLDNNKITGNPCLTNHT
jgi:hypothetical protein